VPTGPTCSSPKSAATGRWQLAEGLTSSNYIERVGSTGIWRLGLADGSVETHHSGGRVATVANVHGVEWTFTCQDPSWLVTLALPNPTMQRIDRTGGQRILLSWLTGSGQPAVGSIQAPNGAIYTYTYRNSGTAGLMASITYPATPSNVTGALASDRTDYDSGRIYNRVRYCSCMLRPVCSCSRSKLAPVPSAGGNASADQVTQTGAEIMSQVHPLARWPAGRSTRWCWWPSGGC